MFTTLSSFRSAFSASASLLLLGGAALCSAPQAHAQGYLVGALLFAANGSGATTSTSYQYDTNTSSPGVTPLNFTFNGTTYGKGIAILLPNGSNTLSFVENAVTPISSFGGTAGDLGLFFSSTNTPYNPSSGARTPDLLVSRATDGSTAFFFPTAGTTINDYVFPASTAYSGATNTTAGLVPITATGFSVDNNGSGTVTLQVGAAGPATPEPGSIALLVGMGLTGGAIGLRRRKTTLGG
jgi:hypothetical protein